MREQLSRLLDSTVGGTLSPRRRAKLVRQLRVAHDSLASWDLSLRALTSSPALGSPYSAEELLQIVAEAKHGLNQLLAQMGDVPVTAAVAPMKTAAKSRRASHAKKSAARNLEEVSGLCLHACRSCGEALGAAFREAQAAADAASARLLYGPLRAIEKQIWMIDPRQARF